jgi:hypothetical protein
MIEEAKYLCNTSKNNVTKTTSISYTWNFNTLQHIHFLLKHDKANQYKFQL